MLLHPAARNRSSVFVGALVLALLCLACEPTATPLPTSPPADTPAARSTPTLAAGVTSIFDIQRTGDPNGASPLVGQTVTTRGAVTAVFETGDRVFIQDPAGGPWSGLYLFRPAPVPQVGDRVEITGRVNEFRGLTEIDSGRLTVLGRGTSLPPQPVTTGEAAQEQWESVLLRVQNVRVTEPDLDHGEWVVDDGTGPVRVDDLGSYNYEPAAGDQLAFVVGPLYFSFDSFKLEPRTDDDIGAAVAPPAEVAACAIQGTALSSPYVDQVVVTRGIVTADLEATDRDGFFLQPADCDGDPATSDGLFIYDRGRDLVSVGDQVRVRGEVREFFGLTEIAVDRVDVLSSGNQLPVAVTLDPPPDAASSKDYFEAREGTLVRVPSARVVGPTSRFGEFAAVTADAIDTRHVFEGGPVGEIFLVDDAGVGPFALRVGDNAAGLEGVLDYSFGSYKFQLTQVPTIFEAPDPGKLGDVDGDGDVDTLDRSLIVGRVGEPATGADDAADLNGDLQITSADVEAWDVVFAELSLAPDEYTIAGFNVENLFDDIVDPGKQQTRAASSLLSAEELALKLGKLAEAIHDDLREPTVLGLMEVEKIELLEALAAQPEIETDYGAVLIEGPDGRGIDVGLLFDRGRVTVLEAAQLQGCTTLAPDTGGPDVACDADGDGVDEGNLLFSRPPLLVRLVVNRAGGGRGDAIYVIVAHFKSKRGGAEKTEPRRIEQALFLAGAVNDLLAEVPGARIAVLGDLNDALDSPPINTLTSEAPLGNLWTQVVPAERYSYVYNGVAEVLDYVMITPGLLENFERLQPVRINADFPEAWRAVPATGRGSSDHDPVGALFRLDR
jgi:predicted extracellular nuclease